MEELIINKLVTLVFKNETPSGVVIAGVLAFLLYRLKSLRTDVSSIKDDINFIKLTLLNRSINNKETDDDRNIIRLRDEKPKG